MFALMANTLKKLTAPTASVRSQGMPMHMTDSKEFSLYLKTKKKYWIK